MLWWIVVFVSSIQRLSPPHLLLSFIPHLHPCHSPYFSPPHVICFFHLYLYFSVPPCVPLHPHIWNGCDCSYWFCWWNQRNGQPISCQANRVTIIHEAVLLLCHLHPCHVCMCNAFPLLVPILHISYVHKYPSWIYGLFTTTQLRVKGRFYLLGLIWCQLLAFLHILHLCIFRQDVFFE